MQAKWRLRSESEVGKIPFMQRIEPGPGQESVWDYPRPPRVELSSKTIEIIFDGQTLAVTSRAWRVLETSHPPVYYVPPEDVNREMLRLAEQTSFCEWKGNAHYYSVASGDKIAEDAGWYYPNPTPAFEPIRGYIAFYPSRMDACFVDGERVRAQKGDFYGGWITSAIVGPFKGGAGSRGW